MYVGYCEFRDAIGAFFDDGARQLDKWWELECSFVVERRMLVENWIRSLLGHGRRARNRSIDVHLVIMRLLGRVVFILVAACATVANEAENEARAKGLMCVRAEVVLGMGLGGHYCIQPGDMPDEPEPEKPPCPKGR